MKKIKMIKLFLIFLFPLLLINCNKTDGQSEKSMVNPAHLNHLYEDIQVNGKTLGIVHIYADFPEYKYVEAKGEGIACVDDAARAEIFYMKYYNATRNKEVLSKIKNLTNFLLYMQAPNGFFYNFIWKDYTIDSTYKTSVAEPNWWSWRAIWTLAEAQKFFNKIDPAFAKKIEQPLEKSINVTTKWLATFTSDKKENFGGIELPTNLPYKYAADQAAILVKAFIVYYQMTKSQDIKMIINRLCNGIISMQVDSKNEPPYNVFLSWQNTWHQWGNSQADALIDAGIVLQNKNFIKHALKEINTFYPYLMKIGFVNDFTLEKTNNQFKLTGVNKYSQIAYGLRPMIFAALNAYKYTGDKKYAQMAANLAQWFVGNNPAKIKMYNYKTGVCFDGILNEHEANKNSGAESTIESLLSFMELQNNPSAYKAFLKEADIPIK